MAAARMKAAEKPLAWRKRQGTASEQVRADLKETIAAKRAAEAADLSKLALPAFPGHSASNEVKAAWAQAVLKVKAAMPRTEAEREMEFRLASQRRDYEACGFKWHEPVPISMWVARRLVLSDTVKGLMDRIAALEKAQAEQKAVIAHVEKHSIRFAGSFDLSSHYPEGAITRFKGLLYVAVKDIAAGKAFPPREGSGWAPFS